MTLIGVSDSLYAYLALDDSYTSGSLPDIGWFAGFALGRVYDEHPNGLLIAITERRTKAQIDELAEALGAAVAEFRGSFRTHFVRKEPRDDGAVAVDGGGPAMRQHERRLG